MSALENLTVDDEHGTWFGDSYLQAGADFIATATYQASIMGFMKHLSVSSSEAEQLLRKAVSVCMTARDNFWQDTTNHAGLSLSFMPVVHKFLDPEGGSQKATLVVVLVVVVISFPGSKNP